MAKREAGRGNIAKRVKKPVRNVLHCPLCGHAAIAKKKDARWCKVYPCGHECCLECLEKCLESRAAQGLRGNPCWECNRSINRWRHPEQHALPPCMCQLCMTCELMRSLSH